MRYNVLCCENMCSKYGLAHHQAIKNDRTVQTGQRSVLNVSGNRREKQTPHLFPRNTFVSLHILPISTLLRSVFRISLIS